MKLFPRSKLKKYDLKSIDDSLNIEVIFEYSKKDKTLICTSYCDKSFITCDIKDCIIKYLTDLETLIHPDATIVLNKFNTTTNDLLSSFLLFNVWDYNELSGAIITELRRQNISGYKKPDYFPFEELSFFYSNSHNNGNLLKSLLKQVYTEANNDYRRVYNIDRTRPSLIFNHSKFLSKIALECYIKRNGIILSEVKN